MKWTDEKIKKELKKLMNVLDIKRMPTNTEMRNNKMSGLSKAIGMSGGIYVWSKKLSIPIKKREKKWDDNLIEKEIIKVMKTLCIDRMPSSDELHSIKRMDLQNAIARNGGFRHWSERLKVETKDSETSKGLTYETFIANELKKKGYDVSVMSSGHPYDLLINKNVKIDVKAGTEHYHFGSKYHTFRPSSEHSTCDIYVCVALSYNENVENIFVIPSKFAKVRTINIGNSSKYNAFISRWDYIEKYSQFYHSVKMCEGCF